MDDVETVRSKALGKHSTNAKLIYDKTENTLTLQRTTTNEKFSFTTITDVDYKIRPRGNELKAEKLTDIKPLENLNTSDPDTFNYVQEIQANMSHTSFNAKNINMIEHPTAVRIRQQTHNNFLIRRGSIDPNWRDYNSGGGIF